LQDLRIGQQVNIEVDILAKYVRRALGLGGGQLTPGFLAEHGFI
jgi:riboflavin synthase alpha subunit